MRFFIKKINNFKRLKSSQDTRGLIRVLWKYYIRDTVKLLLLPRQKWAKKKIRVQQLFHSIARDPKHLMPAIKVSLRICITYHCNLSCRNCYTRGLSEQIPGFMELSEFEKLIKWAAARGWRSVSFLGGEPLLHPDFSEMLDICYANSMYVNIATNNLLTDKHIHSLTGQWYRTIFIDYNAKAVMTEAQRDTFDKNLSLLKEKKINFAFSYAIDDNSSGYGSLLEDLGRFKPDCVRVSLLLPDYNDDSGQYDLAGHKENYFNKARSIQERCIDLMIPYFNYRPIPQCIMSDDQWRQYSLNGILPDIAHTRCPLGYDDDYAMMLTVNPDLSVFPCPAVYEKKSDIFSFATRDEISSYYKEKLRPVMRTSLIDECGDCKNWQYYNRYLHKENLTTASRTGEADTPGEKMCQGGCLTGSWHRSKTIVSRQD